MGIYSLNDSIIVNTTCPRSSNVSGVLPKASRVQIL